MHSMSHTQFQIDQMRKDKMILGIESIAIAVVAMMVTVFLPQLLFQFYYVNQTLTAEPPIFKYIPLVAFSVTVLYFVYASVMLITKKMQIMKLEKDLAMLGDECDCGHHHHDHGMMAADDEASTNELAEAMSRPARKSTKKASKSKSTKTTKKTTKK